jgi:hypothetical protein
MMIHLFVRKTFHSYQNFIKQRRKKMIIILFIYFLKVKGHNFNHNINKEQIKLYISTFNQIQFCANRDFFFFFCCIFGHFIL